MCEEDKRLSRQKEEFFMLFSLDGRKCVRRKKWTRRRRNVCVKSYDPWREARRWRRTRGSKEGIAETNLSTFNFFKILSKIGHYAFYQFLLFWPVSDK